MTRVAQFGYPVTTGRLWNMKKGVQSLSLTWEIAGWVGVVMCYNVGLLIMWCGRRIGLPGTAPETIKYALTSCIQDHWKSIKMFEAHHSGKMYWSIVVLNNREKIDLLRCPKNDSLVPLLGDVIWVRQDIYIIKLIHNYIPHSLSQYPSITVLTAHTMKSWMSTTRGKEWAFTNCCDGGVRNEWSWTVTRLRVAAAAVERKKARMGMEKPKSGISY